MHSASESGTEPFHQNLQVKTSMKEISSPQHLNNGKPAPASASVLAMPSGRPTDFPDRSPAAPERVLAAFQDTMQAFLEVQRTTMLAYLSGRQQPPTEVPARRAGSVPPPERAASIPHPPPASTTRLPAQHEAEAVSPATTKKNSPAPAPPVAMSRPQAARHRTRADRISVGGPASRLPLEAELGIDSIKRVEILGKLRDAFPQLGNAADPEAMDRLASTRTLAAIV